MHLEGKVAIVTAGGGPGIGRGMARALADEGAAVMVTDIRGDRVRAVAEELSGEGMKVLGLEASAADKADVRRVVDETVRAFGSVDILVNHAGTNHREPIETLSEEGWRKVLGVSLDGTFFSTQAVIPHTKARGWGRIVSTASRAAYRHSPSSSALGLSAYAAAKAGIIGFSRSAAQELGPFGITVNVIAPGIVSGSGMSYEVPVVLTEQDHIAAALDEDQVLPPRYVRPDEIASALMYFVGPGSDRTTGQVLHVNGGSYFNA